MMASTSTSYDVLSDEQKRILTEFYNKGMTTTAKNMREVILKAAEQTATNNDKVKVNYF